MNVSTDRLYELLPVVYRLRDADQGYPMRALLRVIAKQVDVVEEDIAQLYENWFIETCEDWVVPYIGDLIGYQPVHEAGEPGEVITPQGRQRNKILIPRREVANTIRYRRRKGTLALLELLANDVAGWPARAVEFFKLLGWTQAINHLHLDRGRTVDLRIGDALDRLAGPFDELAHTVEVRRTVSHRTQGYYNIPSIGVFVWRLRAYSVTQTPAACLDESPHCYNFSVVGNDTPLYNRPQPETEPTHIAEELNLPTPIRRRRFETHNVDYYGEDKSLQIWIGMPRRRVSADRIIPADLSDWRYRPGRGYVAVDPERGRIAFPPGHAPGDQVVWVSYHYAFSADIGGGEYDRPLSQPAEYTLYPVGEHEELKSINEAVDHWRKQQDEEQQKPKPDPVAIKQLHHAVIEITDSGLYEKRLNIVLKENESLQIRAANRKRPVIGLSNVRRALPDALNVQGGQGSRFTLDGLLIVGRAVQISAQEPEHKGDEGMEGKGSREEGGAKQTEAQETQEECEAELAEGDLAEVTIRHSTLVPGWALECNCEPQQPSKPGLELLNTQARITIEHSIIGAIQVIQDEVAIDPVCIRISDSILDAISREREALGAPGCPVAPALLTIARSTVIGRIQTHAIERAENTIFDGLVKVARRQQGCMRFCYVTPGSRTPRRYECQPDLVEQAITERFAKGEISPGERDAIQESEHLRVEPVFSSTRYGTPTYCQLAHTCAEEIKRGADDESEMGVFHDLYQPQRGANLRARLDEYTPAGMEAGIIYAS